MQVTLKPDLQQFVEEKVRVGEYASPEEAVNALLSQARELEQITPDDLIELRSLVDVGLAEADRGEFVEFTAEDVIAERRAAMSAKKKAI